MYENRTTANRLYRSRRDRMVSGVAGGLGQYLGIDPTLVRLVVVIITLAPGVGLATLFAYILAAIVIPERPVAEEDLAALAPRDYRRSREIAGYVLAGLGVVILAGNLGLYNLFAWDHLWPVALIGVGILLLLGRRDS